MREHPSDTAAALKTLAVDAFVIVRPRLEHGGALQARRLAIGAVQLYWRFT